jgi:hypothetical protein
LQPGGEGDDISTLDLIKTAVPPSGTWLGEVKDLLDTISVQHPVNPTRNFRLGGGGNTGQHLLRQWTKAPEQQSLQNQCLTFQAAFLLPFLNTYLPAFHLALPPSLLPALLSTLLSTLLPTLLPALLSTFFLVILGPLIKFFRQGHFQFLQATNLGDDEGVLAASAQQGPNPEGEDAFEFRLARQPVGEQIDQPQQIPVLGWVLAVAAADSSPPGRNRRSRSSSATTAR